MRKNRTLPAHTQGISDVSTFYAETIATAYYELNSNQTTVPLPEDVAICNQQKTDLGLESCFWAGIHTICKIEKTSLDVFIDHARKQYPDYQDDIAVRLSIATYFCNHMDATTISHTSSIGVPHIQQDIIKTVVDAPNESPPATS